MLSSRSLDRGLFRALLPKGISVRFFAYTITALLALQFLASSISRAQNPAPVLADSWNGVHSWLSLRINGGFTDSYLASIAWRYDYASSYHNAAMVAAAGWWRLRRTFPLGTC